MKTILLTGGGTAGHCQPNVYLLPYLKKSFDKICYIGSNSGVEKSIIQKQDIPFYSISCVKLKREFCLDNFLIPFKLVKSINESKRILKRVKPDVVFSKGGYVSLPTVIACHKLKIPVISHESDLTPGLANKIASKFSTLTLTSFPETANCFSNGKYVGSPLKDKLDIPKSQAKARLKISTRLPVLLVLGGSLGSVAINKCLKESIEKITRKYFVVHVTGKNNKQDIQNENYLQMEFCFDMPLLYSVADLVLSRAGSNTLFEIMQYQLPSVIVPLPKSASRGDQIDNANYFAKKGALTVLYQEDLLPSTLLTKIEETHKKSGKIIKNIHALEISNASQKICELLTMQCNNT